ncbi:MAG: phosphoribosyltransferase [Acidimicrobiia bacterium]|jgi:putative phosphoribosyl transferase|nr:phosphoribosyltransferase [Acidimicrobiia bacterium]
MSSRGDSVPYVDRSHAGSVVATHVAARALGDPVVLALPRGGVPTAEPIARRLGVALEVMVARKVGAPGNPELGIGAVGEGGSLVADDHALRALGITPGRFDELAAAERTEVARRVQRYRGRRPLPDLLDRQAVLVDDGLATGVTAEAALRDLRDRRPQTLLLAVPVGVAETVDRLRRVADDVICAHMPARFRSVGEWYQHFDQTTDDEVCASLERWGPDRQPS